MTELEKTVMGEEETEDACPAEYTEEFSETDEISVITDDESENNDYESITVQKTEISITEYEITAEENEEVKALKKSSDEVERLKDEIKYSSNSAPLAIKIRPVPSTMD